MFKHLFVLCLFALALNIEASTQEDFKTRVEWVKELKTFVLDLEQKNPEFLTTSVEKNLLHRFSLFEEAIASGNYDCFFAGWPSTLVKSNGKRLCVNPARGNSEYQKGSCKAGQLQCQPAIFGKGICVGFNSPKDKQMAFASCDSKFKQKGNYNFLKTMSAEEKAALKEVSSLAHKVCVDGSVGVQKSKPMCKSLMKKFPEASGAIDRAPATTDAPEEDESSKEVVKTAPKKIPAVSAEIDGLSDDKVDETTPDEEKKEDEKEVVVNKVEKPAQVKEPEGDLIPITFDLDKKEPAAEECKDEVVVDAKVAKNAEEIVNAVNHEADSQYALIKKEFLASALCAPEKVLNDPKEKLSPVLFEKLMKAMEFVTEQQNYPTRESKKTRFKEVADEYELSEETIKYGEELLSKYADTSDGRYDAMARLRGVMLQNMEALSKEKEGYQSKKVAEGLIERGIFVETDNGAPECPFVSEDAFREALAGRETILKSGDQSKVTNPDLITIVDYSQPSNQRRMYVIDLKTNKVLHNTWSAQGGGKDRSEEKGADSKGSFPKTSDAQGSNLSSEGFYLARAAGSGETYLNNVTLEGLDQNNSNMAARSIVVHGWRTPNQEYVNKTWEMSEGKNPKRLPGKDIYKEYMGIDFKNTKVDLFNASQEVRNAAEARPAYMDATDGCLGVPDTMMGHADRKGRDKSQLELLREDLPGSIMYNYMGEGKTQSKFLK